MHPEDTEQFLFDDFFVSQDDSDPGERVEVEIRERKVPVYVKRGLSFADREAAKSQAVTTRVKPNGTVEITKIDDGVFAVELLFRCIKSWPFTYASGKRVPITREVIKSMLSDGLDALALEVIKRISKRQEQMAPFTSPSESN